MNNQTGSKQLGMEDLFSNISGRDFFGNFSPLFIPYRSSLSTRCCILRSGLVLSDYVTTKIKYTHLNTNYTNIIL